MSSRVVHKVDDIEVWRFEPSFLDALEPTIERSTKLEIARSDGRVYATVGAKVIEGAVEPVSLTGAA
jgi:hypothetical protein